GLHFGRRALSEGEWGDGWSATESEIYLCHRSECRRRCLLGERQRRKIKPKRPSPRERISLRNLKKVGRRRRSDCYCLKRWCPRSESIRHAFKGDGFSSHFGFRRRRSRLEAARRRGKVLVRPRCLSETQIAWARSNLADSQ